MKYLIAVFILIVSCKPSVSKDCDYSVTEYSLKESKIGRWGIVDNYGNVLGYSTRYFSYGFYEYDSFEAMTFDDSCKAKGLLKQYLFTRDKNSFK